MKDDELNALLAATWRELQQPQVLWQLLAVALAFAAGWAAAYYVRRALAGRLRRSIERDPEQDRERARARLASRYGGLAPLFTPFFAWLFLLAATAGFRVAREPAHLLRIASILAIAFVGIHLGLYAVRRVFKPSPGLAVVERWFGMLAWLFVALHVLGLLPEVVAVLSGPEATFTFGKTLSLNVWQVLQAAFWIAITLVAALWAGKALDTRLMHADAIDGSTRVVLARVGKAILIVVAILVAMRLVDIDITVLSVFGGALGVGLGLGLQRIASNYVSGFIILLDRSLRLGDVITVDKYNGKVTEIRTRCTVVRADNGVEALVPNELLLSQPVQNFSLGDKRGNVTTRIRIAYDGDVDRALALLTDTASAHSRVLADPPVSAMLAAFAVDGIELELSFWVPDPEKGTGETRSDVNRAIWTAFRAAGIRVPVPAGDARGRALGDDASGSLAAAAN